ncbi:sugar phosphate isomerase/epimerase family protein [Porcipelethomonas sp.]|uniref:sugar phosphate isomerase/epimerase family protein n=1 Tax=Porcipelethomonas sp. TaxID=2981675 RepID=UPI003EF55EAF
MKAGVSTACLYPRLLEESLYDLAVNGIDHVEIFVNTDSELKKSYVSGLMQTLKRFEVTCRSLHPYSCPMEPMMFFSVYERRVADALEYYKRYFNAMNILGAEIFVFHGNKNTMQISSEFYCERFHKLVSTGKEFGITVAQENVSRCTSGSLSFMKDMVRLLGDDAKFVLDTKQAVRAGENSFNILRTLKNHIVHVHLSDNGELGDCLQIGRGRFNIKQFLGVLEKESPDCSVMLELYRSNFDGISDLVNNFHTIENMIAAAQKSGAK